MSKIYYETLTGEVQEFEVADDKTPCRHKNIELYNYECIGQSPIWICTKCGEKFNKSQLEDLQKA